MCSDKKKAYIKIEVVSYHNTFIESFIEKLLVKLNKAELKIISLPKKKKLFSVLKSPFVNKKAIEQFSLKRRKKLLFVEQFHIEKIKNYLKEAPLKNVAVKIKEYSLSR